MKHPSYRGYSNSRPTMKRLDWLAATLYHSGMYSRAAPQGTRTNNHVEGWHNRLKKVVGKAHPNVFEIVETFKKEQASTEVSIAQLATGAAPTRRNRRATERNKKIEELKTRFTANSLTLDEYLSGVSAHTNL